MKKRPIAVDLNVMQCPRTMLDGHFLPSFEELPTFKSLHQSAFVGKGGREKLTLPFLIVIIIAVLIKQPWQHQKQVLLILSKNS